MIKLFFAPCLTVPPRSRACLYVRNPSDDQPCCCACSHNSTVFVPLYGRMDTALCGIPLPAIERQSRRHGAQPRSSSARMVALTRAYRFFAIEFSPTWWVHKNLTHHFGEIAHWLAGATDLNARPLTRARKIHTRLFLKSGRGIRGVLTPRLGLYARNVIEKVLVRAKGGHEISDRVR